jgi:hypothetical protein
MPTRATTIVGGVVLAVVIGSGLAVLDGVGRPLAPVVTDTAAMQAWGQRLEAQAQVQRAEQLRQARMWNAWTNRLNGQAGIGGMSDRAIQAWSDRLNGLAEYYLISDGQ